MLIEDHIVTQMVKKVRIDHPGMGGRKFYHLIKEDLEHQQISGTAQFD